MKTVLVLGHAGMGHGDTEVGQRILRTFLQKCRAIRELQTIVLFNSGVKLAAVGSPVLSELQHLYEAGIDILPCGTCLEFFDLTDKLAVGEISNMDAIVNELSSADKVITL